MKGKKSLSAMRPVHLSMLIRGAINLGKLFAGYKCLCLLFSSPQVQDAADLRQLAAFSVAGARTGLENPRAASAS